MGRLIRYIVVLLIGIAIGFYMPEKVQEAKNHLWQKLTVAHKPAAKQKSPSADKPLSVSRTIQNKPSSVKTAAQNTPPAVTQNSALPAAETKTLFTVQVASFSHKNQAQVFIDQLHEQQIDAYIAPQDLKQNQKLYRVYVGEYLTKRDAEIQQEFLSKRFNGAFVKSF